MRIHVGKGVISVVQGDIADQDTEAIINAANNHLWMGGGGAGAIKRKGGAAIEQEAMAKGPIEIGTAVSTTAGVLKAHRVIHAAVMGQDLQTGADLIVKATRSSLSVAEKEGLASVALPALGTGVGGFSLYHCASLMIGEVIAFMVGATKLREARFVLFDAEACGIFEKELKSRFTAHGHA
jgi:O-acetyl-ADP-ribose deacetylase